MAGHEAIACGGCHREAAGSVRQQLQAAASYLVGLRAEPVALGHLAVTGEACLDCHVRAEDRHPVYRFREPRFRDALTVVDARSCLGCHAEHTGRRVANDGQFCAACHGELALKSEPLDVPHSRLVAEKRWDTCLGCHDFHGNHAGQTPPAHLAERVPLDRIRAYLVNGPLPYPPNKREKARESADAP